MFAAVDEQNGEQSPPEVAVHDRVQEEIGGRVEESEKHRDGEADHHSLVGPERLPHVLQAAHVEHEVNDVEERGGRLEYDEHSDHSDQRESDYLVAFQGVRRPRAVQSDRRAAQHHSEAFARRRRQTLYERAVQEQEQEKRDDEEEGGLEHLEERELKPRGNVEPTHVEVNAAAAHVLVQDDSVEEEARHVERERHGRQRERHQTRPPARAQTRGVQREAHADEAIRAGRHCEPHLPPHITVLQHQWSGVE